MSYIITEPIKISMDIAQILWHTVISPLKQVYNKMLVVFCNECKIRVFLRIRVTKANSKNKNSVRNIDRKIKKISISEDFMLSHPLHDQVHKDCEAKEKCQKIWNTPILDPTLFSLQIIPTCACM